MQRDKDVITEATLRLDAAAIKRIREQQELTQLYVARMVGVTTDTISRWENKQFPTVKRGNAERLAAALEVELEEILPREAGAASAQDVPRQRRCYWLLLAAATVAVILLVLFGVRQRRQVQAQRVLPSYASAGAVIPVQLRISGSDHGVVREKLPVGWHFVAAVPPPASVDERSGVLRWIIHSSGNMAQIVYLAKVADDAQRNAMACFSGEVTARNGNERMRTELIGAECLVIDHINWADLNGDCVVDDDEMLDASYISENAPDLPLDLDSVEQLWIEDHYYWDDSAGCFKPGIKPSAAPEK